MRYRSEENVLDEVRILYESYGINLFVIADDLFTAHRQRVKSLLRKFKTLDIPGFELQFPNALSINTLTEDLLDDLIKAGMKIAVLAIDSGSEYVQKNIIKKNCNLKKAKRLVKYLHGKGMIVRCYFILGFPGETKEMMEETIEFADEIDADWSPFQIATPLIGSEMYSQFVAKGDIDDDIEYWSSKDINYTNRDFDTEEISAEELNALVYRSNLVKNFLNNRNLKKGQFKKAIDIFNDILDSYPFHIIALSCLIKCYEGMKHYELAFEAKGRISELLRNDKDAQVMYTNYRDLMPEEHVAVNSSI